MTNHQHTQQQRDELAQITMSIPDEHFVSDRYGNYAVEYPEKTIIKAADGSIWYRDEYGDWSTLGMGSGRLGGPATVLHMPEAAS